MWSIRVSLIVALTFCGLAAPAQASDVIVPTLLAGVSHDATVDTDVCAATGLLTAGAIVQANRAAVAALAAGHLPRARLVWPGAALDLVADATAPQHSLSPSWQGRVEGSPGGHARFVVHDGVLAGVIRTADGRVFDLQSLGDDRYRVRQLDVARLATCGGAPVYAPASSDLGETRDSPGVGRYCDDGSVIDVLVVYTTAARVAAGSTAAILAQIDLAFADANDAFAASLTNTQVRLVHAAEVAYAETGDWQIDGPRLVNPSDGYLDEVHPLRDAYGADCVSLWVNTLNTGGIGYFPHPSLTGIGASGFSMLRLSNAPLLTFAHEIGHNLFCAHDRPNAPDPPFADYSYGYLEPGGAWHDLMATTPAAQLPYFANPNLYWPGPDPPNPGPIGVPVGQPNPCDVALTINQTRFYVANFRATHVANLPPRLYVRSSAPAGGDGRSWPTAMTDLDEALCTAAGSAGAVTQIWVAAGTYRPGRGSADREATFQPVNGVTVYGGFAGGETSLVQRDPAAHVTILSGDIGTPGVGDDNAYHVVTLDSTDATAVLDGFTITGGNADGDDPHHAGGGVRADGSGQGQLVNCRIVGNRARQLGAGVFARNGAAPTLADCTIENNVVVETDWPASGGGVAVYSAASASLTDCVIRGNSAPRGGGLSCLHGSSLTLERCEISGHDVGPTGEGGGIYAYNTGSLAIDRCVVADNSGGLGGGVSAWFGVAPQLTNCIIRHNTAATEGGAAYFYSDVPAMLAGCLLNGNQAPTAAAISCLFNSNVALANCTLVGNAAAGDVGGLSIYASAPTVANCIFWANTAAGVASQDAQIRVWSGSVAVSFSTVQGWTGSLGGAANDGINPQLVDADGPDNVYGTADDNPRLPRTSPAVNHGSNAAVPAGLSTDLDGRPRIVAGVVDRGSYEFAPPGDYNGSGAWDAADLPALGACLAGPGLAPPFSPPATADACRAAFDRDGDGDVDLRDVAALAPSFGSVQ